MVKFCVGEDSCSSQTTKEGSKSTLVATCCMETPHLYICMYVHVCMYVCMHACMYVSNTTGMQAYFLAIKHFSQLETRVECLGDILLE